MIPATKMIGITFFIYNDITTVGAYVGKAMEMIIIIPCDKQGFIQEIFQ
jgi:hypothetical protein